MITSPIVFTVLRLRSSEWRNETYNWRWTGVGESLVLYSFTLLFYNSERRSGVQTGEGDAGQIKVWKCGAKAPMGSQAAFWHCSLCPEASASIVYVRVSGIANVPEIRVGHDPKLIVEGEAWNRGGRWDFSRLWSPILSCGLLLDRPFCIYWAADWYVRVVFLEIMRLDWLQVACGSLVFNS